MAVPTQLQNRLADTIVLFVISQISQYAKQRAGSLRRAASAAEGKERDALNSEAEKFDDVSKTFGALTEPDKIP